MLKVGKLSGARSSKPTSERSSSMLMHYLSATTGPRGSARLNSSTSGKQNTAGYASLSSVSRVLARWESGTTGPPWTNAPIVLALRCSVECALMGDRRLSTTPPGYWARPMPPQTIPSGYRLNTSIDSMRGYMLRHVSRRLHLSRLTRNALAPFSRTTY